jgi:hypothetical protein
VPVHRVVADEMGRPVRHDVGEKVPGEGAAQGQAGPFGGGQQPAIAGSVPRGEVADRAEQVGHRPPAGGDDGRRGEDHEPGVRRAGQVREEGGQQRLGLGG